MSELLTEKKCGRCGTFKPTSEFTKNKSRKDGLNVYCKSCISEIYPKYKKAYYERHPHVNNDRYHKNRERELHNSKNYRASRLELLWSLKTPCIKCGEERKCSIHFHHIEPGEKTISLSHGSVGKKKIMSEVKKCVCLCANCHEEFHYIYGHQPEHPVEALQEYLEGEVKKCSYQTMKEET